MAYQRRSIKQAASAYGSQASLSFERLESRALLAGLINLSEALVAPASAALEQPAAEVRHVDAPSLGGAAAHQPATSSSSGQWEQLRAGEDSRLPTDNCDAVPAQAPAKNEKSAESNCPADSAERDDSLQSDFTSGGVKAYSPATPVGTEATADAPSTELVVDPTLINLIATASHLRPAVSPQIPETLSRPVTDASRTFHYFDAAAQPERTSGYSLNSEPLSRYARRESFVELALLTVEPKPTGTGVVDGVPIAATASTCAGSPRLADHALSSPTQSSPDVATVRQATTAIAEAMAIVHAADAACTELPTGDSTAGNPLAGVIAVRLVSKNNSSTIDASSSALPDQPLKLGLCSLMSMLLTFRSPARGLLRKRKSTRYALASRLRHRQVHYPKASCWFIADHFSSATLHATSTHRG